MRHWIRMTMVLAALPSLGGCYSYTQVERATVAPGSTVRVALDRDEAVRHIDALGGLRERLEGQVRDPSDGVTLSMTVRRSETPADGGRFNAFVTVPWASVTRVEVKRFSAPRTAVAALGGAALGYGVLSVLEAVTQGSNGEGPNQTEAVRIPLLRLGW